MGCDRRYLTNVLNGNDTIPASRLVECFENEDPHVRMTVYELLASHNDRIQPRFRIQEVAYFMVGFYIDCIVHPNSFSAAGLEAPSPYEAAADLLSLLLQCWAAHEEHPDLSRFIVDRVTRVYLRGNDEVRTCIEAGFLEHAFEFESIRGLFDSWKQHAVLKAPYHRAREWGEHHGSQGESRDGESERGGE